MRGRAQAGRTWGAGAGVLAGPAAWITNTTLNFALVTDRCASGGTVVPLISAAMLAVALAGAALSWRAWRDLPPDMAAQGGSPRHMLAVSGVFSGLLFALVILLQGAAGMVFHGCEG